MIKIWREAIFSMTFTQGPGLELLGKPPRLSDHSDESLVTIYQITAINNLLRSARDLVPGYEMKINYYSMARLFN